VQKEYFIDWRSYVGEPGTTLKRKWERKGVPKTAHTVLIAVVDKKFVGGTKSRIYYMGKGWRSGDSWGRV